MARKSIIVDVGFNGLYEDFIRDIETVFGKIDFAENIGLSNALNEEIAKAKEAFKQFQKELAKDTPTIDLLLSNADQMRSTAKAMIRIAKQIGGEFGTTLSDSARQGLSDIEIMLDGSGEALKGIAASAKKAGSSVSSSIKAELGALEKQASAINRIIKDVEKGMANAAYSSKGKNTKWAGDLDVVDEKIESTYANYSSLYDRLDALDAKRSDGSATVDEIKAFRALSVEYGKASVELSRLLATREKLGANMKDVGDFGFSYSSLKEQLASEQDQLLSGLGKIKTEIGIEYVEKGGEKNLSNLIDSVQSEVDHSESAKVKIPMVLSPGKSDLAQQAIDVLDYVQQRLADKPLEISVQLMSGYRGKKNAKILEDIKESLGSIEDDGVKERLSNMISGVEQTFKDQLIFTVEVNTESAETALKLFLSNAKAAIDELKKTPIQISPEVVLAEEAITSLQAQLDKVSQGTFTFNVTKAQVNKIEGFAEAVGKLSDGRLADGIGLVNALADGIEKAAGGAEKSIDAFNRMKESIKSMPDVKIRAADNETKDILRAMILGKLPEATNVGNEDVLKSVKTLEGAIKAALHTKPINDWSRKFIKEINAIGSAIKSIFGGDTISNVLREWTNADTLKLSNTDDPSQDSLRERSFILGSDGKVYGGYIYDREGETRYHAGNEKYLSSFLPEGIKPIMSAHSHGELLAKSSINKDGTGDISSLISQHIENGIRSALVVGLREVEEIDIAGLWKELSSALNIQSKDDLSRELSIIGQKIHDELNSSKGFEGAIESLKVFVEDVAGIQFDPNEFLELAGGKGLSEAFSRENYEALFKHFQNWDAFDTAVRYYLNAKGKDPQKIPDLGHAVYEKKYGELRERIFGEKGIDFSKYSTTKSIPDYLHQLDSKSGALKLEPFNVENASEFNKQTGGIADNLERIARARKSLSEEGGLLKVGINEINPDIINEITPAFTNLLEVANKATSGIDFSPVKEGLSQLLSELSQLREQFSLAFGTYSSEDISAQLSAVDAAFQKLAKTPKGAISQSKKNTEEVKAFLSEYQKYLDMGGDKNLSFWTQNNRDLKYFQDLQGEISQTKGNIGIVEQLTNAITKLGDAGESVSELTKMSSSLTKLINSLGDENAAGKIERVKTALQEIAEALKQLNGLDSSIVDTINTLNNIKDPAKFIKALSGSKEKKTRDEEKKAQTLRSQELLNNKAENIGGAFKTFLADHGALDVISTKMGVAADGLIHLEAVTKDANNELKRFSVTTKDGDAFIIKGIEDDQIALRKYVDELRKAQDLGRRSSKDVPDFMSVYNSHSPEWAAMLAILDKAGVETEHVVSVTRQLDGEWESFFVTSKNGLEETTQIIGRTSSAILKQTEALLDSKKAAKEVSDAMKEMIAQISSGEGLGKKSFDVLAELRPYEDDNGKIITKWDNLTAPVQDAIRESYSAPLRKAVEEIDALLAPGKRFSQEVTDGLNGAKDSLLNLIETAKGGIPDIAEAGKALATLYAPQSGLLNQEQLASQSAVEKTIARAQKALNENTQMPRNLQSGYEYIVRALGEIGDAIPKSQLKEFNGMLESLNAQLQQSGQTGKSFAQSIANSFNKANAQFIAQTFSFMRMISYIRSAAQTVTQIDTALTELRKVSDASTARLNQNLKTSAETAKDLGASIYTVINATADWARLGYSVDAAEELARVAVLYKNVGDNIDVDTATSSLISTIKGFQLSYTEAEGVIDKFNEVANNFAIDTAGIGEALKRSAAAFNVANTDLAQSIALITAANEVVQNPEQVGTMWTTVSARIRGASAELEDLGEETDEYTKSTSKLRNLVKQISGVDIMVDDNTYKDLYTIIVELADVWDTIQDVDQAALLEALAGKRQGNRLIAAIKNVDTLKNSYRTAVDSAGSAMREQLNYEKSIQYSIEQFTASMEELKLLIVDRGLVKGIVDLGSSFVGLATDVMRVIGPFTTLSTILMGFLGAKGSGLLKSTNKGEGIFGTGVGVNLFGGVDGLKLISEDQFSAIVDYNRELKIQYGHLFNIKDETTRLQLARQNALSTEKDGVKLYERLGEGLTKEAYAADNASIALQNYTTKSVAAKVATAAFNFALNAGLTMLIGFVVQGVSALINSYKNAGDAAAEAGEKMVNTTKGISDYAKEVTKLRDKLADSNTSITEQASARERLLEIQSELIDAYGVEAGNIDVLTASVDRLTGSFAELQAQQWEETKREINGGAANSLRNFLSGAKDNLDYYMKQVENYEASSLLGHDFDGELQIVHGQLKDLGFEASDLQGNLFDVYETLLLMKDVAAAKGYDDGVSVLQGAIDKAAESVEKYRDIANQYILNEKILKEDPETYTALMANYDQYVDALTNGKTETANALKETLANSIASLVNDPGLESDVKRFYEELFPGIVLEVAGVRLSNSLNDAEIKGTIQTAIDQFEHAQDIAFYDPETATEQQKWAYAYLIKLWRELGYTSGTEFVEGLKEAGIYSSFETSMRDKIVEMVTQGFGPGFREKIGNLIGDVTVEQASKLKELYLESSGVDDFVFRWEYYIDSLTEKTGHLTDELKEQISTAKSNASSLSGYYEKLLNGTLSNDELSSLIVEFPELTQTTDSLEGAMHNLAVNGLDEVIKKLEEENLSPGLIRALKELRKETDETFANLAKVESYSSFGASAEGLDIIDKIYQDVKDGETFDYSSILNNSEFNKAFGNLDAYESFVKTIADSPDDIKKCQQAFNDLATEYVFSTDAMRDLTAESKKATVAFLEQKGVVNALEVADSVLAYKENEEEITNLLAGIVTATKEESAALEEAARARLEEIGIKDVDLAIEQALTEQKALEGLATLDLANATREEIQAFLDAASAANITSSYIAKLYLAKLDLGNLRLNTSSDINQIIGIANAAGTSAQYVDALRTALNNLQSLQQKKANAVTSSVLPNGKVLNLGHVGAATEASVEQQVKNILAQIQKTQLNPNDFKVAVGSGIQFGGAKGSSSGSSASDAANEFLEVMDWIEVKISRIERDIENLDQTAEATWRNWTTRTQALADEIETVTEELAVQQKGMVRYLAEAESVGLSEYYKQRVRNGEIDIERITDENLKQQIDDYQTWYFIMPPHMATCGAKLYLIAGTPLSLPATA